MRALIAPIVLVATIVSSGCGGSPITAARIERAIAPTFANLLHLQVPAMGLPAMSAAEFAPVASCRKVGAGGEPSTHSGSGEWVCTVQWRGPGQRPLRDVYDLFVMTDGCYTATVEGESLARPVLTTKDGREVRNLLYVFDGCFDTT